MPLSPGQSSVIKSQQVKSKTIENKSWHQQYNHRYSRKKHQADHNNNRNKVFMRDFMSVYMQHFL